MTNEFIWFLHQAGYEIVAIPGNDDVAQPETTDKWIRPATPSIRSRDRGRMIYPLQDPALFRTFADLGDDENSIVSFANRRGLLTSCEQGESIDTWRSAIADIGATVRLWEKGTKVLRKTQELSLLTQNTRRNVATVEKIPKLVGHPVIPAVYESLDAVDSAVKMVNQRISNVRLTICRNYAGLRDDLSLQPVPTNMLEAMWLQLGLAISGNKSFRKCPECDDWFEISEKAARFDKIFCKGACKAKAYRRRLCEQIRAGPLEAES